MWERWLEALNAVCVAVAQLTLGIATALPVCAQLQPAKVGHAVACAPDSPAGSGASKLEFDAAAVRPSAQKFLLKGVDFLNPAGDEAPPKGGLFSWNVSLPWLINFAYDLRSSQERRGTREALPKWEQDEWYTIEARAEGNPTRDDVHQMVRALLKDRFQFAAHLEKREGQVYALVVAKPGLGLKPHPERAPCTLSTLKVNKYPNTSPSYDVTMQQIADWLGLGGLALPLSVVDQTGLKGRYDAVLDFGPNGVPPNADPSDEIGLPPLSVALEKRLGLRLVKENAQVETVVVDHIGELSKN